MPQLDQSPHWSVRIITLRHWPKDNLDAGDLMKGFFVSYNKADKSWPECIAYTLGRSVKIP